MTVFDELDLAPNVRSFIVEEMSAPHRHYHSIRHLTNMVSFLEKTTWEVENFKKRYRRCLLVATFFHDIVYDPLRADNEEMSVVEFKLRMTLPQSEMEIVEQMIMASKRHTFLTGTDSGPIRAINLFLKADLSILWSNFTEYKWYAYGVRQEYGHVPNEAYRIGRERVLDSLSELGLRAGHDNVTSTMRRSLRISISAAGNLRENIAWEKKQIKLGNFDV